MIHWQLFIVVGIVFIIIEIFTPVVFFLNLALASFLTAILAFFIVDWNILIPVFAVSSLVFLLFLRPILVRTKKNGEKTGVEEKYIGKIAKVTDTITLNSGVISIYNERWEARSNSGEEISIGSEVKIIRNESLLLYVEKSEA
jgi:membrane protein implicated in regulation of membrane protease activity